MQLEPGTSGLIESGALLGVGSLAFNVTLQTRADQPSIAYRYPIAMRSTTCATVCLLVFLSVDAHLQIADGPGRGPFAMMQDVAVQDVEATIERITAASGLAANFTIVAEEGYGNAAAVIVDGRRIIVYDPLLLQTLEQQIGNAWAPTSVIAHEVAHHLNGHTVGEINRRHEAELEADFFSGFILRRMGASLPDALAAVRELASDIASPSHPARDARVAEITRGWNAADQGATRADQALADALTQVGDQADRALEEAARASAAAAGTQRLALLVAVVLVPLVLVALLLALRIPRREVVRMAEQVTSGVRRWHRRADAAAAPPPAAPVLALTVAAGSGATRDMLLRDAGLEAARGGFVIGRHPPLVDEVVADASVSHRHARVTWEGGRFYIEDLNSTNGTAVNGARLEPFERQAIAPGDELLLGDMTVFVRPVRPGPDTHDSA